MFGVSDGTLREVKYALDIGKPIGFKCEEFDEEWMQYYMEIGHRHGWPLDDFLIRNF